MNKLSTERAIDALDTVRAYYASLTAGYPKGKDCKAIDDVTCSEIANSCLMAIKALEQEPCEDCISRQATIDAIRNYFHDEYYQRTSIQDCRDCLIEDVIKSLPSVTPQPFINKPCVSEGVCREDKIQVLDKIRAEIEQLTITEGGDDYVRKMAELFSLKMKVLHIIDKYKAESEG